MEMKAEKLLKSVQEGCKKELTTVCKDVTPGEGRVLACLYAFEDKLSSQCEYALYDAATQLQHAVAKLTYVANECSDDMEKYCAEVAPGQGRIINCLKKNEKKLNERCATALKETAAK
ncbi:MAG: hypothetical protein KCHDKBKB_01341 [Elusimicrobia bacterium]|nr:hypothetical protein [Elusimicrobiota bacterium]